jgi:hypothetical protein
MQDTGAHFPTEPPPEPNGGQDPQHSRELGTLIPEPWDSAASLQSWKAIWREVGLDSSEGSR